MAQCTPAQAGMNEPAHCFWVHGLRQWGHANGDEFGSRSDWSTDGAQFGVDREFSDSWKGGITFGYADSGIQDATGGHNDLTSKMAGLYANYTEGRLGLGTLAFYSANDNSTRRNVEVNGTPEEALADFGSNNYGLGVRLGYRLTGDAGPLVRPFLETFYNHLQSAHFAEGNAGAANLDAQIHGREDVRGTLGVQVAQSFEAHRFVFRPALQLGATHEFADVRSTLDLRPFGDGTEFRTYGPALARNSYTAKASLDVSLGANALVTLGYGGEIADNYSQHEGSLSFRMAW
jgi:outer membrane autotransporter protein